MREAYCQTLRETTRNGISIRFLTLRGGHHPPHWHDQLELIFPLNGDTDIILEGRRIKLTHYQVLVVESGQVHSIHAKDKYSMFLSVHISKQEMERHLQDIQLYYVKCLPEDITEENREDYEKICSIMSVLLKHYVKETPTFPMEAEALVLLAYAQLLQSFSTRMAPQLADSNRVTLERIRTSISYVEEHFREPISLQQIADEIGLGKEAFCRFFKKNMGVSFLQYLGEVRISNIYQDLLNTDDPISVIMERNGFTNQKLCNRMFKEIYGCTPSEVRKNAEYRTPSYAQNEL